MTADLMHLSMRRCGGYGVTVPQPPNNEQRLRAWLAIAPARYCNPRAWTLDEPGDAAANEEIVDVIA